jgi:hypothetical protein
MCAPHLKLQLPSNKLATTNAVPCGQAWSGSFRGGNRKIPSTSKRVRTA